MIGVPPIAGFISKWYLGLGALEVNAEWVVWVLLLSGLLNAAYFLPLLYRGWFAEPAHELWHEKHWPRQRWRLETHWMLLLPAVFTALLSVLIGIFAASVVSPLTWSQFIVSLEFAL